ncbi:MAG: hypothetical protein QQN63_06170, partial [Nitrosopumilus sp.]
MANTYYSNVEQKPERGDLILEIDKDSPAIVTRVYGYRFERVRIGPKTKAFKPIVSSWNKPASQFIFIQHQDDVEWPYEYADPVSYILGDIFKTKNDKYLMYTGDINNGDWMFVNLDDDFPVTTSFVAEHVKERFTFVINQNSIVIPNYTLESLKFLFESKDNHYPEMGDIYSDKYNVCYQVVEMPTYGTGVKSVKLAAMSPKSYHSLDDEWPMYMYKEKTAYDFFVMAKFLGTPEEVKHAPNIGDIYQYADENKKGDVYLLIIDVKDLYLAPVTMYINENAKSNGHEWDSLEQFISSGVDGYEWTFIQNQEDFDVTFEKFEQTITPHKILPAKKEQIKLGTLLAYTPNADTYHDGIVVTTGSDGFSVWWLNFEGGNEPDLQEGFKQTFKYDKHLPLFLYNGHQDDYSGEAVSETPIQDAFDKMKDDEAKDVKIAKKASIGANHYSHGANNKPPIEVGQIIDFTTISNGNVTTCMIVNIPTPLHFELVILDKTNHYVEIQYEYSDYFEVAEWSYVQHQDNVVSFITSSIVSTITGETPMGGKIVGKIGNDT